MLVLNVKKTVCNVCGVAEVNEDADGWIYGKQVCYRHSCKRKSNLFTKRKSIISGAVPSNKQRRGGGKNLHHRCWHQISGTQYPVLLNLPIG